jgi:ketosteroid isomerase-like protein
MTDIATIDSDLDPATETLAADFIAGIVAGDAEAVAACCAPDVVIWHNNDNLEVPLDKVLPLLRWLYRHVGELAYADVRRQAVARGYVQRHVVRGIKSSNGFKLELPACFVVEVRDGLIVRLDEYLDSAVITALTAKDPS